ncbi:MAG: D-aminoacyl-tRNA deacylase [Bacteroidales bacterium]|jgi:D-tyrosyl-tRNA(Tyr) deacylase|nr:D-aminoacyl-tRNA deacylase [Bacteroidales bacterium]MCU0410012.1 D-aminoacyl-tRNA deacylase [Bacteroidales bacterium]
MRILIQRVKSAFVTIDRERYSSIDGGLLVFLGIEEADESSDIDFLAAKLINLRLFDDSSGVMNLSALDTGKEIMIISQFTLHASTRKGNRPSYIRAARPEQAIPLYEKFIFRTEELLGRKVSTGIFGAMMEVNLINDGPVTILIDSKKRE